MTTVAIVGASGYTGAELIRLLQNHPSVELAAVTSRAEAGRAVGELFPSLSACPLQFTSPEKLSWADYDVVFFATPHATAMHSVPQALAAGARIIDLSADFRLRDVQTFEHWYGVKHAAPEWLAEAVYGLPELFPEHLADARLVACAGCYPTAVQLACAPLLAAGLVQPSDIIANCISGLSGAGRSAKIANLFSECSDSFAAYASAGHRHQPEIEQGLSRLAQQEVQLLFQPHLSPMNRGIHATVYLQPTVAADWQQVFEGYYAEQDFVQVRATGQHPATRDVRGGNSAHLSVTERAGRVIVLSVIDNLVKGASGQAIQCLNLMQGWPANRGLERSGLLP